MCNRVDCLDSSTVTSHCEITAWNCRNGVPVLRTVDDKQNNENDDNADNTGCESDDTPPEGAAQFGALAR